MEHNASIDFEKDCLHVSGDLNFATVVSLWVQSLTKLQSLADLTFDMAKVHTCNSAGLALMLEWVKYAKRANKKIQFKNIPANLASIIKVAGVNNILATT